MVNIKEDHYNDDLASAYEKRTTDAIQHAKAALLGASKGAYKSLPRWLRMIIELIIVIAVLSVIMYPFKLLGLLK